MPVPNAPTEIVNLALDIIKTENINDILIPDGDKVAGVCNRWYEGTRQASLEGFPWNFASTHNAIPLDADVPDANDNWADAYQLPNNYLSLNYIKEQGLPLSQWNYVIEVNRILINNGGAENLNIGYVFDQTDVTKFSPSFKLYLAAELAEKIVYKLTGNPGLQNRVSQAKQREMLSAKAKNGKANPPIAFRQSRMLNARRIYGGASIHGRPYGRA